MPRPKAARASARAFSLIETFVAMVILTLAVLALVTAYPYAFGRIGERDDELQAVSFGQQYLEQVRQQIRSGALTLTSTTAAIDAGYPLAFGVKGYPAPGTSGSPPPALGSPGNFTATATTNPTLSASANEYDVNVTVSWTYGGAPRSVQLQTIVTRI